MSASFLNNNSNIHISGGVFTQANAKHDNNGGFEKLEKVAVSSAMHTAGELETFDRPKCYENTRVAILKRLMDWMLGNLDEDKMMMWLYGDAGAGKSAISQTLAERCAEDEILLASFFFSRNDASRFRETPLVATIAYQAAIAVPGLKDYITAAVDKDPKIFKKKLQIQFTTLLVNPINAYCSNPGFDPNTFPNIIIIDGLDECADRRVQCHILDVLSTVLSKSKVPLKVLVASRPEIEIAATFDTGPFRSVSARLALNHDPLQADNDIRHFLEGIFQKIKETHPLKSFIPDSWPEKDVIERLVKASSGQFIYASTVARYIAATRSQPVQQLEKVFRLRPTASAKDLPFAELDALYIFIFSVINMDILAMVLKILGLMILAKGHRDFLFNEAGAICSFFSLQDGELELYLADLASMLNWITTSQQGGEFKGRRASGNKIIRITHASLSDFLLDPVRSREYHLDPSIFWTDMALVRLSHLNKGIMADSGAMRYSIDTLVDQLRKSKTTPEVLESLGSLSFVPVYEWLRSRHQTNSDNKETPRVRLDGVEVTLRHEHVQRFLQFTNDLLVLIEKTPEWKNALPRLTSSFDDCIESISATENWVLIDSERMLLVLPADKSPGDSPQIGLCRIETSAFVFLSHVVKKAGKAGVFALTDNRYASTALHCFRYIDSQRPQRSSETADTPHEGICMAYYIIPALLERSSGDKALISFLMNFGNRYDENEQVKKAIKVYLKRLVPIQVLAQRIKKRSGRK